MSAMVEKVPWSTGVHMEDMDEFLVTEFQISFKGSLINQSIVILIYRNRSLQQYVHISLL